jgi:hypothetical protein
LHVDDVCACMLVEAPASRSIVHCALQDTVTKHGKKHAESFF